GLDLPEVPVGGRRVDAAAVHPGEHQLVELLRTGAGRVVRHDPPDRVVAHLREAGLTRLVRPGDDAPGRLRRPPRPTRVRACPSWTSTASRARLPSHEDGLVACQTPNSDG